MEDRQFASPNLPSKRIFSDWLYTTEWRPSGPPQQDILKADGLWIIFCENSPTAKDAPWAGIAYARHVETIHLADRADHRYVG